MTDPKDFADGGIDLIRTKPYIDVDEWRDEPTRHRFVHGGFENDETRFSIYFPPPETYAGRFFQPLSAVSGSRTPQPRRWATVSPTGSRSRRAPTW